MCKKKTKSIKHEILRIITIEVLPLMLVLPYDASVQKRLVLYEVWSNTSQHCSIVDSAGAGASSYLSNSKKVKKAWLMVVVSFCSANVLYLI